MPEINQAFPRVTSHQGHLSSTYFSQNKINVFVNPYNAIQFHEIKTKMNVFYIFIDLQLYQLLKDEVMPQMVDNRGMENLLGILADKNTN